MKLNKLFLTFVIVVFCAIFLLIIDFQVIGGLIISNNYNNRQNLKNFKKPILIVHSKEDRVVNFKLGKQIFKNANQPKEFFEIDKPHINGIRFYHNEISNKIDSLILKK
ncbi:hypothetical protein SAMN04489756_10981 [Cloacibacterium normanense]|nr:hypothetical protein SAMN04489756_10981 [Cloacibacterium normanense]